MPSSSTAMLVSALPASVQRVVTSHTGPLTRDQLHQLAQLSPEVRCEGLNRLFEGASAESVMHYFLSTVADGPLVSPDTSGSFEKSTRHSHRNPSTPCGPRGESCCYTMVSVSSSSDEDEEPIDTGALGSLIARTLYVSGDHSNEDSPDSAELPATVTKCVCAAITDEDDVYSHTDAGETSTPPATKAPCDVPEKNVASTRTTTTTATVTARAPAKQEQRHSGASRLEATRRAIATPTFTTSKTPIAATGVPRLNLQEVQMIERQTRASASPPRHPTRTATRASTADASATAPARDVSPSLHPPSNARMVVKYVDTGAAVVDQKINYSGKHHPNYVDPKGSAAARLLETYKLNAMRNPPVYPLDEEVELAYTEMNCRSSISPTGAAPATGPRHDRAALVANIRERARIAEEMERNRRAARRAAAAASGDGRGEQRSPTGLRGGQHSPLGLRTVSRGPFMPRRYGGATAPVTDHLQTPLQQQQQTILTPRSAQVTPRGGPQSGSHTSNSVSPHGRGSSSLHAHQPHGEHRGAAWHEGLGRYITHPNQLRTMTSPGTRNGAILSGVKGMIGAPRTVVRVGGGAAHANAHSGGQPPPPRQRGRPEAPPSFRRTHSATQQRLRREATSAYVAVEHNSSSAYRRVQSAIPFSRQRTYSGGLAGERRYSDGDGPAGMERFSRQHTCRGEREREEVVVRDEYDITTGVDGAWGDVWAPERQGGGGAACRRIYSSATLTSAAAAGITEGDINRSTPQRRGAVGQQRQQSSQKGRRTRSGKRGGGFPHLALVHPPSNSGHPALFERLPSPTGADFYGQERRQSALKRQLSRSGMAGQPLTRTRSNHRFARELIPGNLQQTQRLSGSYEETRGTQVHKPLGDS